MKKIALLAVVAAGLLTAGCGYRDDLQRPPPMWGKDSAPPSNDEDEDAQRQRQESQSRQNPQQLPPS